MKIYQHPGGFAVHYNPITGFLGIPRLRVDPRSLGDGDWITPTLKDGYIRSGAIERSGVIYSFVEILRWISRLPDNDNYVLHFRNFEDGLKADNLSWVNRKDHHFLTNKLPRISKGTANKPYRVKVDSVYFGLYTTLEEAQQVANEAVQARLECIQDIAFTY